jgi:hypothetical protein
MFGLVSYYDIKVSANMIIKQIKFQQSNTILTLGFFQKLHFDFFLV